MTALDEAPVRLAAPDAEGRLPLLQRPLASYYLLLASTGLLLVIGLVMVFSASSVRSYATFGSSYAIAARQAIFIAVGLVAMAVASRLPVRFWRAAGTPLLLASLAGLVVVLVVAKEIDGSRRWIPLAGGFNLQPSEVAKLALALWGADLLVRKKKLLGDWKHLFVPLLPVTALVCLLIMLEPDMGTTLTTVTAVIAMLWVVGTPMRYFGAMVAALVAAAALLAVSEPYRMARLLTFTDPCDAQHRLEGGYQACQGLLAMGSGGIFGLGLGASREKWAGGLPNAYTDFVFAIIGEELGLLGTLAVLLLVAVLAYTGIRIARRADDTFVRLTASAVTAWITVQALINISTVVGLVPITGIPLPLVSHGGSALISTLFAIGMLLSFARIEPGAPEALADRRRLRKRLVPAQRGPARVPAQQARR